MKWRLAEASLGLVPEKILIQEFNQEKIGANVLRIARCYRKQKKELQNTLDTINYKYNYYRQAVKDGTEFYVKTNSKHS